MNEKDPKEIQVKPETAKLIAQTISAEIKASRDKNKKTYERAKRCENQYNQITKYMESGKECDNPWPGAADYYIPLTEWTIDAVWSRALSVLLSKEPYMTAQGVGNPETFTDFVDQVFRDKVKLADNFPFFIKQILKLPFAVISYDWCARFEPMISKEVAITFVGPDGSEQHVLKDEPEAQAKSAELIANGFQPQGEQEVWASTDIELENGPKLKYIKFDDYVWCPDTKKDTRPYWEGDRFWLTSNEIMLEVQQEHFIKASGEAVIKSLGLDSKSGSERAIASRSELIECYRWFGRLPFNKKNEIDFADAEAIEQEVNAIVAVKDEELLQIKAWPHKRTPFPNRVYIRGSYEDTENFEGRSLAEKLYMTQKEMNTFYNTLLNNAWLAMQKVFVKKKTLGGDEWDKPTVYPGAMWEEENSGDVRVLEVGDVKSIGLELEQTFLSFAEKISNISIYQTGAAREKGGNKTLGEVQATIREANLGLDKFIHRCNKILVTICDWTLSYYQERMPADMPRKMRGESGSLVYPIPENQELYEGKGYGMYWGENDIQGVPEFTWNGTTLNSSDEWNLAVANDMMERYLPQPMVAGSLISTWEILRRGLVARHITDWDKILPSKEAILKEMELMRVQAAQQQTGQPGQSAPRPGRQVLGKTIAPNQAKELLMNRQQKVAA